MVNDKIFYIYLIISKNNGGVYVGCSGDIKRRWANHKICGGFGKSKKHHPLYNSMRAHGIENHEFSIIESYNNRSEASEAEIWWISYFKYLECRIFNCSPGGEGAFGFTMSDETREKIRQARIGIKLGPMPLEQRANISAALKGKPLSLQTREKLSKVRKGKKPSPEALAKRSAALKGREITPEHRAKISAANKGKKRSEEVKKQMSLARIGKKMSDEHRTKTSIASTGRFHSEETKQKISELAKNRIRSPEMIEMLRNMAAASKGKKHPPEWKEAARLGREKAKLKKMIK